MAFFGLQSRHFLAFQFHEAHHVHVSEKEDFWSSAPLCGSAFPARVSLPITRRDPETARIRRPPRLETMAGDEWRCRRHPSLPCSGACPHCLRDRLCPRPCPCAGGASTSGSALIDRDRQFSVHGSGDGCRSGSRRRQRKRGVGTWRSTTTRSRASKLAGWSRLVPWKIKALHRQCGEMKFVRVRVCCSYFFLSLGENVGGLLLLDERSIRPGSD
jgi:hypothetical protein